MVDRITNRPQVNPPPAPNVQAPHAQDQAKWANSPTALIIRSVVFRTLSLITKPFNSSLSDYYFYRMTRVDIKLMNLDEKKVVESIFYGQRLPGGMNIAQKTAAEQQPVTVAEKQKLSEQLLAEVKKNHPNAHLSETSKKELLTEGICFGIMVDLADHYINGDKENMEHFFSELDKGGSVEAEIYQGGIQGVVARTSRSYTVDALYNAVEAMKNDSTDSTLSKMLPHFDKGHQNNMRSVIFNLAVIDRNPPDFMEKIRNNESYSNFLFPSSDDQEATYMNAFQTSKSEVQNMGFTFLMAKAFGSIKEENRSNRTEIQDGKDRLDFSYVQGKMLQELDKVFNKKMENANPTEKAFLIKRREQHIGEIKLAAAAEEYQVTGTITTDPLLNKILTETNTRIKENALFSLKGLSLTPCTDVMGKHVQFRDDAGYLNNLDNLEPGFYFLSIKTKSGGHAVSFIKEADGSGYLIDPNNRKLKFSNDAEAKELANTLVSTYSQPEGIIPGHPYHKLSLFKIEKKTEVE